jgi:hypothetical protein
MAVALFPVAGSQMSDISSGPAIARAGGMRTLSLLLCCLAGCDDALQSAPTDMAVPGVIVGPDGGVAGADASCKLGNRNCDPTLGCTDNAGCDWCGCTLDGRPLPGGQAACNLAYCLGATAHACHSIADCPSGQLCLYDPGCSPLGRCGRMAGCVNAFGTGNPLIGQSLQYCGCDGTTASAVITCAMQQPYLHLGACP